jgi:hypothetical protein
LFENQNPWVYHNTNAVDEIRSNGLDAGSFSSAPIDFGKRHWIAVRLRDLPGFEDGPNGRNAHDYGGVTSYEPHWEFTNGDGVRRRHVVSASKIKFLSGRRRVPAARRR